MISNTNKLYKFDNISIYQFILGPLETNNYLIVNNKRQAILIDCTSSKEIIGFIKNNDLELVYILLTHCHVDHVCGVNSVYNNFKCKVMLNEKEFYHLNKSKLIYRVYGFEEEPNIYEYELLNEGDIVKIEDFELRVLFTPGHTLGSLSFYNQKNNILFTGDVLFYESIGRTDLPGGDFNLLIKTIKEKIFKLPDNTLIFPGHYISTTIFHEKSNNPFLK
jgi:glyoxylase-like metal-dependent hydrolase (beta-lactamase superfamily II)